MERPGRRRPGDHGEPGLNGWEIELFDDLGNLVDTQTTADMDLDSSGMIDPETERGLYWFTGLMAGDYTVREVLQPDWEQTLPVVSPIQLTDDSSNNEGNLLTDGVNVVWEFGGTNILRFQGGPSPSWMALNRAGQPRCTPC